MSRIIPIANRIVEAISKHIIAHDPLTCRCVYIRIDKSADLGVIISALEVVEFRLGVVDVAAIAEGVEGTESGCEVTCYGEGVAPGVVGVIYYRCAAGAQDGGHVTLQVRHIVVGGAAQRNGKRSAGSVVGKGQGVAAYGHLAEGAAVVDVAVGLGAVCAACPQTVYAVGMVPCGDSATATPKACVILRSRMVTKDLRTECLLGTFQVRRSFGFASLAQDDALF